VQLKHQILLRWLADHTLKEGAAEKAVAQVERRTGKLTIAKVISATRALTVVLAAPRCNDA
jgi:hypothetical protein